MVVWPAEEYALVCLMCVLGWGGLFGVAKLWIASVHEQGVGVGRRIMCEAQ